MTDGVSNAPTAARYGNRRAALVLVGVTLIAILGIAAWLYIEAVACAGEEALTSRKADQCINKYLTGTWMAWTWQTMAFFVFIAFCIVLMGALELRRPGGAPRRGILGLDTTRGDRLFISILGSIVILLLWLGIMGTPLWGGLGIAAAWTALVFWKV